MRTQSTLSSPSRASEMALPLSLKGFFADLRNLALFGIHFLQAPVLVFQLFHPLHQRRVLTAVLHPPLIGDALLISCSRQRADTGWPPSSFFNIANVCPSVNRNFLMQNLLGKSHEKILLPPSINFWRDYHLIPIISIYKTQKFTHILRN